MKRPPHSTASIAIAAMYIILLFGATLPLTGLAFNSARLIAGIPLSVLWLTAMFVGIAALTVIAYPTVFSPWCTEADNHDSAESEDAS